MKATKKIIEQREPVPAVEPAAAITAQPVRDDTKPRAPRSSISERGAARPRAGQSRGDSPNATSHQYQYQSPDSLATAVPISFTVTAAPPLCSPRVLEIAAMFGLGVDESREVTIVPPCEIPIPSPGIVFITGPSGSGKSTILRMIARQLTERGELVIDVNAVADRDFIAPSRANARCAGADLASAGRASAAPAGAGRGAGAQPAARSIDAAAAVATEHDLIKSLTIGDPPKANDSDSPSSSPPGPSLRLPSFSPSGSPPTAPTNDGIDHAYADTLNDNDPVPRSSAAASLIDRVGADLREATSLLSLAGLGDAFIMLRREAELSDGQRFRFRLAQAMELAMERAIARAQRQSPPAPIPIQQDLCKTRSVVERRDDLVGVSATGADAGADAGAGPNRIVIIADEFAATLDRLTAKTIARNIRRWIDRLARGGADLGQGASGHGGEGSGLAAPHHGPTITFIIATTHDDLLEPLHPEVLIHKGLGDHVEVMTR